MTRRFAFYNMQQLIVAAMLTIALVIAYDYLPQRTLNLLENTNARGLYSDTAGTLVEWLDGSRTKYRCTYKIVAPGNTYCGLDISLGDGISEGVDLSIYNEIHIKLNYLGSAPLLRIFTRHFGANYSDIEKHQESSKYNSMLLPVKDLNDHVVVKLSEFWVPEWWIQHSGVPRQFTSPEFTNSVHIGIDPPFMGEFGTHQIEINKMIMSGAYITLDQWYLAILISWFLFLMLVSLRRYMLMIKRVMVHSQLASSIKKESRKYKELANIDHLTGLLNRRGIFSYFKQHLDFNEYNGSGENEVCAIILLDIDHFKVLNDTCGHDVGDETLIRVGLSLLENVRVSDRVCRWGGEEFLCFCLATDLTGALSVAEKMRSALEKILIPEMDNSNITASFGIACITANVSVEDAVKQADEALYLAKKNGRNRCEVWTDSRS